MTAWEDLDAPWRACLQLAWEAYGANTIPVGAVLTDAHGGIVARGRNRVYERDAAPGELSYSLLAHAEINALVGLPPNRYYDNHTLYTTLEPCALCVGATAVATVGTLRFAGADPYGGGHRPDGVNPQLTRAPLRIEGPLENAFGALAAALLPAFYLRFKPDGRVVRAYDDKTLAVAQRLVDSGAQALAASGLELGEALPRLWPALASTRDARPPS